MKLAWITGCFGFVGPYVARELLGRGARVIGIDRPGSVVPPGLDAEAMSLDLSDADAVAAALRKTRPDVIVHLAAQSSAALSFEQPGETLQQNIMTTVGVLEGIRAAGETANAPRLLSVGSCEEYGTVEGDSEAPVSESQMLRPASPYAVSKAAQTLLCLQYHRAYDLPIICTRSFNHTGPGHSERFVFSSFAKQIATLELTQKRGVLEVGNLEAVRDFSDVRDVARAYVELLERAPVGEAINVCSGRGLRIRDGLDLLLAEAKLGIEVRIDPKRLRPLDVPRFVGDASRLVSLLGWKPETPASTTLADLLADWRLRVSEELGTR